ncbi:hypothetical protein L2E82_30705 [Cichorium intybus]|uniref:Uncharacterized protein n=1 Tax=Cichorium intybus TaxID=13427 RepID=A0ACB9D147_CICIN|nr:hypothetical protein L2E82_30705 [Cichorium intybus]
MTYSNHTKRLTMSFFCGDSEAAAEIAVVSSGVVWWLRVEFVLPPGACGIVRCNPSACGIVRSSSWFPRGSKPPSNGPKPQSTVVKSFNQARIPAARPVSTAKIVSGSYAAVLQGDIGTSTRSEFIEEDVESDEDEEHVSCNDESEKESDTEDTMSKAPSPFVDAASAQTPSHPPGYTPPCSLARQVGENGVAVANVVVDKPGDSSRPDVITDQQLSRSKKDGQAMGFNMEGCLTNME